MKRLVRITDVDLPGPFDVTDAGDRERIRQYVAKQSRDFTAHYAHVAWEGSRPNPPNGPRTTDGEAAAFLNGFVATSKAEGSHS